MANSPLESLKQGTAPLGMRMAIADGLFPLEGAELVEALGYLIHDKNAKVVEALREGLPMMPRGFLMSTAQTMDTDHELLHFMAEVLIDDEEITQIIILNRNVADETLVYAAGHAPPPVLEILAQNRNRMLEYPPILKALLENDSLSKVSRYALIEFQERFQVDVDDPGYRVDDYYDDDDAPAEEPDQVAEAVAVEEPPVDEVDDAQLQTGELPVADIEEDLDPSLLEDEDVLAVLAEDEAADDSDEDDLDDDEYDDDDFEEPEEGEFEDIKGFNDGWNIDTLVKEVSDGDESLTSGVSDGFDDLLDIDILDEEDAGEDDWMGDDVADLAADLDLGDEDDDDDDNMGDDETADTRIRLMKMSAAKKLILAQMGTKQERAILVTDPNKKVAIAVVEGPKMSEYEIVRIAANRQVYEEVLRAIAKHREWGKSSMIRRELVLNPKTPLNLSVRMLPSLNEFILKDVVKSKDLPSTLVNQAKRVLTVREKRRGG